MAGKGRPAAHSNGILSRAAGFGPPRGGREATSSNIGAGVVGTTFCGSAGRPPAPLFVRLQPAEPGGAPSPRPLPPGPGLRGTAGRRQPSCRSTLWEPHGSGHGVMSLIFRDGNWFQHLKKYNKIKATATYTSFKCGSGEGCSNDNSNGNFHFLLASQNYRLPPELSQTRSKDCSTGR